MIYLNHNYLFGGDKKMNIALENESLMRNIQPCVGLNTWVHYYVMNKKDFHILNYSTEQHHALQVMNQLQSEGYRFQMKMLYNKYSCKVWANDSVLVSVDAETFELAVCRASLLVRRMESMADHGLFMNGL